MYWMRNAYLIVQLCYFIRDNVVFGTRALITATVFFKLWQHTLPRHHVTTATKEHFIPIISISVTHANQPLAGNFIVKPSRYIILLQKENWNASKTYIGTIDMKKSKLFLLIICSQNTYKQFCESVHTPNWFLFTTPNLASKISDRLQTLCKSKLHRH